MQAFIETLAESLKVSGYFVSDTALPQCFLAEKKLETSTLPRINLSTWNEGGRWGAKLLLDNTEVAVVQGKRKQRDAILETLGTVSRKISGAIPEIPSSDEFRQVWKQTVEPLMRRHLSLA